MQNGFVKSFNGRMREEFLNETLFRKLAHVRDLIAEWVTRLQHSTAPFSPRLPDPAIARSAARDENSAHRAIVQPAPIGVNDHRAPVVAG